jgi:hypothetical protein
MIKENKTYLTKNQIAKKIEDYKKKFVTKEELEFLQRHPNFSEMFTNFENNYLKRDEFAIFEIEKDTGYADFLTTIYEHGKAVQDEKLVYWTPHCSLRIMQHLCHNILDLDN